MQHSQWNDTDGDGYGDETVTDPMIFPDNDPLGEWQDLMELWK